MTLHEHLKCQIIQYLLRHLLLGRSPAASVAIATVDIAAKSLSNKEYVGYSMLPVPGSIAAEWCALRPIITFLRLYVAITAIRMHEFKVEKDGDRHESDKRCEHHSGE
jgi:hypothetical protein